MKMSMRNFTLPLQCIGGLHSSGMLYGSKYEFQYVTGIQAEYF